jgi:sugar transferase (PEP-CTERM/EpsH1 system associated)
MKLFILLSRVPYPLDKGDKLRAFNFIKYLSEYHDIYLFCINEDKTSEAALAAIQPYCKRIKIINLSKIQILISLFNAIFSKLPFQVAYFTNQKIKHEIDHYIAEIQPDHIFCQLVRMAEYVKNIKIPKTIDYQDVFSYGVKRRIQISKFYLKPLLKEEYKRLVAYENEVFELFNTRLIISETDRDLITHPQKNKIDIIPNGVDFNYYKPINCEKEYDIVFTGNMSYPPNVNAALFLVNDILPLVKEKISDVRIQIAGANPTILVRQLNSSNVTVTGWVDDLRNCYANSRVFVAPMRIGTGLQNKLLEAMAMGVPCVSTGLCNNALHAKNEVEILLGNSAHEIADCIVKLLLYSDMRDEISNNALEFVKNNFNWEINIKKLNNLIN